MLAISPQPSASGGAENPVKPSGLPAEPLALPRTSWQPRLAPQPRCKLAPAHPQAACRRSHHPVGGSAAGLQQPSPVW